MCHYSGECWYEGGWRGSWGYMGNLCTFLSVLLWIWNCFLIKEPLAWPQEASVEPSSETLSPGAMYGTRTGSQEVSWVVTIVFRGESVLGGETYGNVVRTWGWWFVLHLSSPKWCPTWWRVFWHILSSWDEGSSFVSTTQIKGTSEIICWGRFSKVQQINMWEAHSFSYMNEESIFMSLSVVRWRALSLYQSGLGYEFTPSRSPSFGLMTHVHDLCVSRVWPWKPGVKWWQWPGLGGVAVEPASLNWELGGCMILVSPSPANVLSLLPARENLPVWLSSDCVYMPSSHSLLNSLKKRPLGDGSMRSPPRCSCLLQSSSRAPSGIPVALKPPSPPAFLSFSAGLPGSWKSVHSSFCPSLHLLLLPLLTLNVDAPTLFSLGILFLH